MLCSSVVIITLRMMGYTPGEVYIYIYIYDNERYRIFCADVKGLDKCNGKAVPLQAWSSPEGSMKLRFPDFMKTAQDGDKVVSLTHRQPLPPGNTPGTHFC